MSSKVSVLTTKCRRCGKRYGIYEKNLSGTNGRFTCKQCGAYVTISKDSKVQEVAQDSLPDWVYNIKQNRNTVKHEKIPLLETISDDSMEGLPIYDTEIMQDPLLDSDLKAASLKSVKRSSDIEQKRSYRFGLTSKFLLFTLIPLLIISALSILYSLQKMLDFQDATIKESVRIVKGISEDMLRQTADSVARQTRQYLFTHPDLKREMFNRNIYFKKVAIQRIGLTGSTSLYEVIDSENTLRIWADADAKLVGEDIRILEKKLGKHFDTYFQLMTGVSKEKVISGYYQWADDNGQFREKYLVSTPIDGTPYAIAASIWVDEITLPLLKIQENGEAQAQEARNKNAAIMVIGLLLIGLILFIYSRGMTAKIHALSDWADRISLGELELETLPVTSRDELGELSKAIARMQDSIRLSIERLRLRRR